MSAVATQTVLRLVTSKTTISISVLVGLENTLYFLYFHWETLHYIIIHRPHSYIYTKYACLLQRRKYQQEDQGKRESQRSNSELTFRSLPKKNNFQRARYLLG